MIGQDQWGEERKVTQVVINWKPPDGVNGIRWNDVNLAGQTLTIYDNDQLVYATITASGLKPFWTKSGLSQIFQKKEIDYTHQWPVGFLLSRLCFLIHGQRWPSETSQCILTDPFWLCQISWRCKSLRRLRALVIKLGICRRLSPRLWSDSPNTNRSIAVYRRSILIAWHPLMRMINSCPLT